MKFSSYWKVTDLLPEAREATDQSSWKFPRWQTEVGDRKGGRDCCWWEIPTRNSWQHTASNSFEEEQLETSMGAAWNIMKRGPDCLKASGLCCFPSLIYHEERGECTKLISKRATGNKCFDVNDNITIIIIIIITVIEESKRPNSRPRKSVYKIAPGKRTACKKSSSGSGSWEFGWWLWEWTWDLAFWGSPLKGLLLCTPLWVHCLEKGIVEWPR